MTIVEKKNLKKKFWNVMILDMYYSRKGCFSD